MGSNANDESVQIIWAGVFQYCVMRVLMTILAVAAQATGTYCEESLSPAFAHVWVRLSSALSPGLKLMWCFWINR